MLSRYALEFGSVADWVSGVGTLLAVGVALWIAGSQQRAERTDRRRRQDEQRASTRNIINEAVALAEQLSGRCQSILESRQQSEEVAELAGRTVPDRLIHLTAQDIYWLHDVAGLRQQMLALQRVGISNVRAYIEISRMAYEADIGYVRDIDPRNVPRTELMRVIHDMGLRAGCLRAIAGEI